MDGNLELVAAGVLNGTGTPSWTINNGGFGAIVDNGTGDYTVTMNKQVDPTEAIILHNRTGVTTGGQSACQMASDTTLEVHSYAADGTAADGSIAIAIYRRITV